MLGRAARLAGNPAKLASLGQIEAPGGEPDRVSHAIESPKDRHSLCYDRTALDSRKAGKAVGDEISLASELGIELLTERDYRLVQPLGCVDAKSSSWLATPAEVSDLGGAIFGDDRFGTVFVPCNGAESYSRVEVFAGRCGSGHVVKPATINLEWALRSVLVMVNSTR